MLLFTFFLFSLVVICLAICGFIVHSACKMKRDLDARKREAKWRALEPARQACTAAHDAAAEAREAALVAAWKAYQAAIAADASREHEKAAYAAFMAVCTATGVIEQEACEAADRGYWAAEAAYEANRKRWFSRRTFPKIETN
jgi:hypothetical protein